MRSICRAAGADTLEISAFATSSCRICVTGPRYSADELANETGLQLRRPRL
jgi:hypothetical protein